MFVSFASAFMSSISTLLNVGSSYIVNDFYIRFIKKNADQKHYVFVSRISTVLLLVVAAIVTSQMESVVGAFKFMMTIGAGTGLVYMLRWFWWRINAWSEITAMLASLVTASVLMLMGYSNDTNEGFTILMLITTLVSTTAWVAVTFMTKPVPDDHLKAFYKRVQPGGRLWKRISDLIPANELVHEKPHIGLDFINWILGSLSVWLFLFGIGRIILGPRIHGVVFIIVGTILFIIVRKILSNRENNA